MVETNRLAVSVEDAADLLDISRTHMYGLLAAGIVKSIKLGRSRRVPVDALRSFVQERAGAPVTRTEAVAV